VARRISASVELCGKRCVIYISHLLYVGIWIVWTWRLHRVTIKLKSAELWHGNLLKLRHWWSKEILKQCNWIIVMKKLSCYEWTSIVSFRSPSLFYLLVHSRCRGFVFSLDHTQTHTTVGRTPLDEGSARRRDLYQTTQTRYKRQKSMSPVGFEPTIPASARPQTYALDRAATGIGGL
jgi:hypothetical protein